VASQDTKGAQDDIRHILEDGALRGDPLVEAIAALGSRHAVEPFRVLLSLYPGIDVPESEARDRVERIEGHRAGLEGLLGRDPGFTVAAFDLLYEKERTLRDPVFREGRPERATDASPRPPRPGPDAAAECLRLEARRAGRSRRPLTVIVLSADEPEAVPAGARENALTALRDGARDVDSVVLERGGDFVSVLPCTGGREGLRAADRLRRALRASTSCSYSAGVAAAPGAWADGAVLERQARQALCVARATGTGASLHRPERRAHARLPLGSAVPARLRSEGSESDVLVEDLSLGGALLRAEHRVSPGGEVVLALRGPSARPTGFVLPSRVLRSQDGPDPGRAPYRAAIGFSEEARMRVAALLAGLRGVPDRTVTR